jgi:hypothetical protein
MNVVVGESLRRRCSKLSRETLPRGYEVCLSLRHCQLNTENDHSKLVVGHSIISSLVAFGKLDEDYPLASLAMTLRYIDRNSWSLSSLGLTDSALNGQLTQTRFLLNHPTSSFSSLREHVVNSSMSVDDLHTISAWGRTADIIEKVASYLPPRRACDHYSVDSGNSFLFDEWYDFALESAPFKKSGVQILLDFADTIQARGCNHAWEFEQTEAERVESVKTFLGYLDCEDACATDDIHIFYAGCYPSHDRRFAVTREKRFCLVPKDARAGHLICFLDGNKVPIVLRTLNSNLHEYQNVGEVYVCGPMHGGPWYDTLEEDAYTIIRQYGKI